MMLKILLFTVLLLVSFSPSVTLIANLPGLSTSRDLIPQFIPQDSNYPDQQSVLSNIHLESAWEESTGDSRIIVAVIDDAIDINHPDLKDNIISGYDFVDRDLDPSPEFCGGSSTELEKHGTQVAGVIGASGNSIGISGVSRQVSIMPLRIGCHYRASLEAEAVKYAIDNGAHIINASFGGPIARIFNADVLASLKAAKQTVLFVTSAGNQHTNNDDIPMYPGNLDLPNVISVAASDIHNNLPEWAQYGASSVDLTAPGVGLKTTTPGTSRYETVSGSSFSTAIVSGVAALIKAKDINNLLTAPDIKAILQASVTPVTSQRGLIKTSGIINAKSALEIMERPRSVITVTKVEYKDLGTTFQNGLIDPNESGIISIELENLWSDLIMGDVRVSIPSASVSATTDYFILPTIEAGNRITIDVPIEITQLAVHQRIRIELSISATNYMMSETYQRYFDLEVGALPNKTQIRTQIQKNDQDDYHYYHLNIPAGMERVAIELIAEESDTRDMGILADFNQRPQINFRAFNGAPYWYSANYRADNAADFERIAFPISATHDSTLKIMVFNEPTTRATSFLTNKTYQLRGCYYSESDGNKPPVTSAGVDRRVNVGDIVTLTGDVTDSDGEITRSYWRASNNLVFTELGNHRIQFEVPSSGRHTFSFVAIDDGCKQGIDDVVIIVEEDNDSEPDGLIINPPTLNIDENTNISVHVSAFFNSQAVSQIEMISAPEGVSFSEDVLSWANPSQIGQHAIRFSAIVEGEMYYGTITINISSRSFGAGGGCTTGTNNAFDPLFLFYILIASIYIRKKSKLGLSSR